MRNLYYLLILICSLLLPVVLSFHRKNPFYQNIKFIAWAILSVFLVFIPWDIFFTKNKIWGFNPDYLLGFYLLSLPLEEWLFFIVVNYSVLFIFHLIELNIKIAKTLIFFSRFFFVLVIFVLLFVLIISVPDKIYTFTVSLVGMALAIIMKIIRDERFKVLFIITLLISLLPFLIVNGALTGFFSSEPIVYYDDTKNLSFRLFTIPIEDLIYNFDMILLASFTYYFSKNYRANKSEQYEEKG